MRGMTRSSARIAVAGRRRARRRGARRTRRSPAGAGGDVAPLPVGRPMTIAWGGDTTLGSSLGLPPGHGFSELRGVAPPAGRRPDRGQQRGHVRPRRQLEVRRRRRADVLRLPGAAGQRRGAAPRRRRHRQPGQQPRLRLRRDRRAADDRARCTAHGVQRDRAPGGDHARSTCPARAWRSLGFSAYPWAASITDLFTARALIRRASREANVVVVFVHAGAEGADQTHMPDGHRDRLRRGPRRRPRVRPRRGRRRRRPRGRLGPARAARDGALPRPRDRLLARQPRRVPQLRHRRQPVAERDPARDDGRRRQLPRRDVHVAEARLGRHPERRSRRRRGGAGRPRVARGLRRAGARTAVDGAVSLTAP